MIQIKTFSLCISVLFTTCLSAQNMNSPYSIYGIGDIDHRLYNRTSGMANTGYAIRSTSNLIDNNPAGISGLTKSFFVADIAGTGKSATYKGYPVDATNSNNKDFWIKRVSVAAKMTNSWASAAGIRQYSNVNYKTLGVKTIEGSADTYAVLREGDGGLNEYFWTNAFSVGKHLALGLKTSVIARSINHTETISDATLTQDISTRIQDYYGQARFQFGAMYYTPLGKKWEFSIGGVYAPESSILSERSITVNEGSATIIDADVDESSHFSLPRTYGAGIALKHNKKTTFTVDYSYEDWNKLKIRRTGWQMKSNERISAGIEFSRQAYTWKQLVEKRYFQLGGFYSGSYLQIRNEPIKEYGFTAGMGGFIGPNLSYRLSLEAGTRGTTNQNLIKENYFQISIGLSFRDFFNSKGRKYD